MESFSVIELDTQTIAIMEQQVKNYVQNTPRIKNSLKVTIEKLCKFSKARNSTNQEPTSKTKSTSSMSPGHNSLRQSLAISSFNPCEDKRKKVTQFLEKEKNFFQSHNHSGFERQELRKQLFKSIKRVDTGYDDADTTE